MKRMKLTTCSGLPANFSRSFGSCVATPAGQVFRWHTRIMMQPVRDQRRRREAEFLGAEKRRDDDVTTRLQLTVRLDRDAAAQIVHHQRLVRLRDTQLPRQACVRNRGLRRRAGAAVVAADQHDVGVRFRDARGDRADADFGDELDADARMAIGVLQIVNQLGQIFDRIDVVVRRRRDQADACRRMSRLRDPRIHLGARAADRLRRASRPAPS